MPRPRRCRWVREEPNFSLFKPASVPASELEFTVLTIEEYEAVKLKDLETIEQKEAAEKMGISQPTFQRILVAARRKIADAIVNGKAIKIEGGDYKMVQPRGRGQGMGRGASTQGAGETGMRGGGRFRAPASGGRGARGGPVAAGPVGYCICPKCGYKKEHQINVPCYLEVCPKCETKLIRA